MANRHKAQALKRGGHAKETREEHDREIEHEGGLKRGGVAKRKEGGSVPGFKSGGRLDKFARGGRAGSDKHPFSSAHFRRGGAAGK